jgi:hypothetical protein
MEKQKMPPKQKENLSGTLNTPNTTIIGNTPTHTKNTKIENIGKPQIYKTDLYNYLKNKTK